MKLTLLARLVQTLCLTLLVAVLIAAALNTLHAVRASESEPDEEHHEGHEHDHDHVKFNWTSYDWQAPPIDAMVHEYKCDVEVKNLALQYSVSYGEHFLATEPLDEHWGWNAGRAHGPDTFEVVDFTRGKIRYYTHLEHTHDHDHDGTEDHGDTDEHADEVATPRCTIYNVSWIELASLEFATSIALFEAIDEFVPSEAWQFAGRSIDETRGDLPVYKWTVPLVHLYDNSTLCVPGFACHHESLLNVTGFNDGELDHLGHVSLPDSVEMFWGLIDGNLSSAIVSRVEAEVAAGDRTLTSRPGGAARVEYSSSFSLSLMVALSNETSVWNEETIEAGSIMSLPVRIELLGELFAKQPGASSASFVRNVNSVMDWFQVQPLNLRMHHDIYKNELLPCYAPGEVVFEDNEAGSGAKVDYRTSEEIRPTYPTVAAPLTAYPAPASAFPPQILSPAFQSEVVIMTSEPSAVVLPSFFWYTDGKSVHDTQHAWSASENAWREAVEFYNGSQILQLFVYNSTSPVADGVVYTLLASTLTDRIETDIDSCSFAPLAAETSQRVYASHPALDLHDGSAHFLLTGGRFNGTNAEYNSYLAAFTYVGRTTIRDMPAEAWAANFTRPNPSRADGSVYTYRQTIYAAPEGFVFPGRDELRREIIHERSHGLLEDAAVLLAVETVGTRATSGGAVVQSYHDVFHFVNYWPNSVPTDTLNPDRANYPCPMSSYSDQVLRFYNLTKEAATATSALLTSRITPGAAYLASNISVNTTVGTLSSPPTSLVVYGGFTGTTGFNDVFVSSDAGSSFVPATSVSGLAVSVSSIYCAAPNGNRLFAFSPSVFAWSTDAVTWTSRSISFNIVAAACAVDRDGNVYVVGGRQSGIARTTTWVTSSLGETWSNAASLPAGRSRHALAYGVVDGVEYFVVGGHSTVTGTAIFVSTNRMQSWQTVTPSSFEARQGASLLISEAGVWIYVGGRATAYSNQVQISRNNGTTWLTCAMAGDVFTPRSDHVALLDVRGYLTVLAGETLVDLSVVALRDVWRSSFSFDDERALTTNCA